MGACVGLFVSAGEGIGLSVGAYKDSSVGTRVGPFVGACLGMFVEAGVGIPVGVRVGSFAFGIVVCVGIHVNAGEFLGADILELDASGVDDQIGQIIPTI